MNQEARDELDRILGLTEPELTESDRAFLQARCSYMTEKQRINFGITEPVPASEADDGDRGAASASAAVADEPAASDQARKAPSASKAGRQRP